MIVTLRLEYYFYLIRLSYIYYKSFGGNWYSLEDFLNDQLFDDPEEMTTIANHLKMLAKLRTSLV